MALHRLWGREWEKGFEKRPLVWINKLKDMDHDLHEIESFLTAARDISCNFNSFSLLHVRCSTKKHAHLLAQKGRILDFCSWFSNFLSIVILASNSDISCFNSILIKKYSIYPWRMGHESSARIHYASQEKLLPSLKTIGDVCMIFLLFLLSFLAFENSPNVNEIW